MATSGPGIDAPGTIFIGDINASKVSLGKSGALVIDNSVVPPVVTVNGGIIIGGLPTFDPQSFYGGASTFRFTEGGTDASGRRQLLFMASNSNDPANTLGGYAGNGGILRLGFATGDGDAENVISEGLVVYARNTAGNPMATTNWGFYRAKPGLVQMQNIVAGVATVLYNQDSVQLNYRPLLAAANVLTVNTTGVNCGVGDFRATVPGSGLSVAEGANARMGLATLAAGTVTVPTTAVGAASRIFLTNNINGGTAGFLRVSAIVNGTSFTITSSSGTDTSVVAWLLVNAI